MLEMLRLLAETDWRLLAFSMLIFDIPRYTFSLISLSLFGLFGTFRPGPARIDASVSVIIPTFNGGEGLAPTIASLRGQTPRAIAPQLRRSRGFDSAKTRCRRR